MEYSYFALQLIWVPIVGYLWWVFKRMQEKTETIMSKEDIKELIETKLDVVQVEMDSLKDRLDKIDSKLEKLIDLTLFRYGKK